MIDKCRRGLHEMTEYNTLTRKGHGPICRLCKNMDKRNRKRTPEQLAKAAAAARARTARKALLRPKRVYTKPVATDGLEDEYGPIPVRVPDRLWVDHVIIARVLSLTRTGRKPTMAEVATFMPKLTDQHTNKTLARVCGVAQGTVAEWRTKHGTV